MNIQQQQDDGLKGEFFIEVDHHQAAKMTYVWAGQSKFIIDHTEVGDSLRGQGAGKQMVAAAVEFARQKGIKIIPLCPFAKSVIDQTVEFQDVL